MLPKIKRCIHPFHLFSQSFSASCKQNSKSLLPLIPPTPKRIPFTVSAHDSTWNDPYHWMRDTQNPDMIDYLNQENDYTESFMKDTEKLQRKLVDEMKSRMPGKITTPPESWGDWLYYQYIPKGKEYPVLCRKKKHKRRFAESVLDYFKGFTKEQILLDWNEIAEDLGYVHVGTCRISPNHKYLAYTLDKNGSEMFVLQIKDLQTGDIISKSEVEGVVSLAWTTDSACLLYTVCDKNLRPYRVYCKYLRSHGADDLIFTEGDMNYCVDITNTKDGKYITINSNSRTSSEEGLIYQSFHFLVCACNNIRWTHLVLYYCHTNLEDDTFFFCRYI